MESTNTIPKQALAKINKIRARRKSVTNYSKAGYSRNRKALFLFISSVFHSFPGMFPQQEIL